MSLLCHVEDKMANRKCEFSREGTELRLTMAHSDITLQRLARAFEVSVALVPPKFERPLCYPPIATRIL